MTASEQFNENTYWLMQCVITQGGLFLPSHSIGAPLGNPEEIRLPGIFEGKSSISGFLFLEAEDIKILGNVVLRRKSQCIFCVSVRPWLQSDIHIWVPSFWNLRISVN
jgi:hypothetical protein